MNKKQKWILLAILVLAIFFRYYRITSMPGGLFPDEAANGLDVNLMQQGHLQPFYERGNGREALFFYFEWASAAIFGKGPWQFHIASALIGILSVLACFLVTKRIFSLGADDEKPKSKAVNIALLASFLMAVSTWHIVLSRTAFRAVQIPLYAGLTFYFLIATYQAATKKKQWLYAALTGISFALGFYTYIAFRIMAPALFAVLFWPLLGAVKQGILKEQVKKYFLPAVYFLIAFVVVIFPIAKYFNDHPGSFIGRAGQVSVFNPTLYTVNGKQLTGNPTISQVLPVVLEVTKTQVLGFFTHGDLNWRSNISGYPFLSPLYSIFFGVGLIVVTWLAIRYFFAPAKKQGWWKYFLLTVWFWGMLLPVVTTAEGIPHGLRSIGVIPPVFIISAWAVYELAQWVLKAHDKIWDFAVKRYPIRIDSSLKPIGKLWVERGFKAIAVIFVLGLIVQAYFLYFVYAANSPENFYYFRSDLTPVSKYLVQRCNKTHTYLVLDKFSVQTTDFETSDQHGNFGSPCNVPYIQVDPEDSWKLTGLTSQDEVVFTQSSMFDTRKFKQYHPDFHLVTEYRNKFGQSIMAVYKLSK